MEKSFIYPRKEKKLLNETFQIFLDYCSKKGYNFQREHSKVFNYIDKLEEKIKELTKEVEGLRTELGNYSADRIKSGK